MRNLLIVLILMTIPVFANAQVDYSMQSPLPIYGQAGLPIQRPNTPKLETVKPIASHNSVEKASAKLAREEQKLVKLADKAWKIELDLRKKQEQLKILENTSENNKTAEDQKNIEKYKKQIAESQDKLNKANTEVDLKTKEVEAYEMAVETAKYTRSDQ
ncbi:hypothetical protein GKZ90_0007425 [Flavobacterium sp. MC2016-06]|uniref:hypothetical protein n=1 Tax=Flavobacterium sp. MC2016-06 TaxID=2676308 RepID=UPI0012BAB44E|nr:hypothetical protein [Flavobacterium sp. MC2016-06]MBU3858142.1 hypothetical protein [Flavobacterium sp. MC2016-06]